MNLLLGLTLGLTAGLTPGPLQTLVVSETLIKGRKAGWLVGLSPLITDAPIVAFSLLLLSRMSAQDTILGVLSLSGAAFLVALAIIQFRSQPEDYPADRASGSLLRGVAANVLSPYPYLFWITVGGPIILGSSVRGISAAPAFILGFYLTLIGSFVVTAWVTDRFKHWISRRTQIRIVRSLSVVLVLMAAFLVREGISHF